MRIAMFAQGTRGDVWPLVALGAELVERGHEVTLATGVEFRPMVEAAGLRFVELPVSLTAYIASDEGRHMLHAGGLHVARAVQALYAPHREAIDDAFVAAAEGAEAMVSMHLTMDRAQCLADLHRVPLANVMFFPLSFTAEHPSILVSTSQARLLRAGRLTHRLLHRLYWHSGARNIAAFRRRLGLGRQRTPTFYRLERDRALGLYAFSQHLLPKPRDWGEHLVVTGFWQLPPAVRSAVGEDMPADLETWLDAGAAPVFLGFGSMPVLEPGRLFADAVEVTRELGVRAVINADWDRRAVVHGPVPDHVRIVDAVDHDRLLPRCVAAVHHGGAGTLGASTRGGLPAMVCSVWADQPFWGTRLERLGAGVHVPFRKLERAGLRAGLERLLAPETRTRAAELGRVVRAEGDGTLVAADRLESWLEVGSPARRAPGTSPARR